jgi:hypothetical protein
MVKGGVPLPLTKNAQKLLQTKQGFYSKWEKKEKKLENMQIDKDNVI